MPFSNQLVKLNRFKIPYVAGIFELVIAIALMFAGGFDTLTDMLVFVIWLFYTLVFVAVIKLRKTEPDLKRPYRVPGYPFVPLVAILGGVFIIGMTLATEFKLAMIGVIATLAGLPLYYFMKKRQ